MADLIGNPKLIPARITSWLNNAFLSAALLRDAGPNANSLVAYEESTPLYLDGDPEIVGEFGEIPVKAGQLGLSRIATGTPKGLAVRVSRRQRDMNQVDRINQQIIQLVNTLVRDDERALRLLFDNPAIPSIAAGAAWDTATGRPRRDFANAMEVVASARPAGTAAADANFGFLADTVVLPGTITPVLMDNDNFASIYNKDSLASEDIAYTGKLPNRVMNLDALQSRSFATNKVLVIERGTVGFFSDFQALMITETYPEGNGPNGGPTQTWRADATRERVVAADQPLAACWITGVTTP
ncbi:MAG: hypothetical protein ACR2JO_08045 [Mycobacteriales bacterium]